jgi:hypothetical protein
MPWRSRISASRKSPTMTRDSFVPAPRLVGMRFESHDRDTEQRAACGPRVTGHAPTPRSHPGHRWCSGRGVLVLDDARSTCAGASGSRWADRGWSAPRGWRRAPRRAGRRRPTRRNGQRRCADARGVQDAERLAGTGAGQEGRLLQRDEALGQVGGDQPSTAGLESARSWFEIVARPAAVKIDAVMVASVMFVVSGF